MVIIQNKGENNDKMELPDLLFEELVLLWHLGGFQSDFRGF